MAGAPYKVYGGRKGENDYADDINTRSLMTNWLGGGSVYMPAKNGKHVPIELSLALHSDAGYNKDGKSTVGALAICTTDYNDGILNSGISRFTSKDFARALRDNLVTDLTAQFGEFGKRYLWDRNYSETRLPEVPSAILEMLSHQNFPDMRIAQDPLGKFYIARSIYKTILRFVNSIMEPDTWSSRWLRRTSALRRTKALPYSHGLLSWTRRNHLPALLLTLFIRLRDKAVLTTEPS